MKRLLLLLISTLSPLVLQAQGGSEALPFVRTDLGPVLTGTAGAAIASPEAGAWSAFRHAAVAPVSENLSDIGVQMHLNGSLPGGAAAFSFKPAPKMGVAVGVMYQSGEAIEDYKTSDMLLSAGAGISVTEKLSVGVNARWARQNLAAGIAYSAVSYDLSFMDKFSDALSAIAGVSAIGGKIESASGIQYSQPGNAYAGMEFRSEVFDGVLSADAMAEYFFSGSYAAALGAGFTYKETVSLRAGLRYASQWCVVPTQISAGAGYSFGNMSINASFVRMSSRSIIALGIGYRIK